MLWILTANSESGDDYGIIKVWQCKKKPTNDEINQVLVDMGMCDCERAQIIDYDNIEPYEEEGINDFTLNGIHYVNYLYPDLHEYPDEDIEKE